MDAVEVAVDAIRLGVGQLNAEMSEIEYSKACAWQDVENPPKITVIQEQDDEQEKRTRKKTATR
jgi:hypothetical protein